VENSFARRGKSFDLFEKIFSGPRNRLDFHNSAQLFKRADPQRDFKLKIKK
jgi:hypothetical protein